MKEFHIKEPLQIFFYNMREMSEFCKSVRYYKNFVRYVQHFTLFDHCWFMRMLFIVVKCPRK